MTNTVLLKRSSVANSVPIPGDLQSGELAINYTDGNLFYKNASNAVTVIASNKTISLSGNITGGNILTVGLISSTGNITGGNLSGTSIVGTLTTAAQTNITSVGTLGSLTVTGNATSGNLLTGGLISATGNITGGNLITAGVVTVTGNISGNYFIGNGSQLTGVIGGGGGGYFNSTLTSYPTGDYGNGELYCGEAVSTDVFEVIVLPNLDNIDPQGSYVTADLGSV